MDHADGKNKRVWKPGIPDHYSRTLEPLCLQSGIGYSPFIHRSEAGTALRYLQFHAGIWDYYTYTLKNVNLNEIRLYQGVKVQWPTLHWVHLIHYGRVEERFEHLQNSETSDFTLRLRYRLTAEFHFSKAAISNLYIPVSAEIFISAGEGLYFNDLIQVSPGIGYDFTDRFSTVFQLYYNLSRNSDTDSFQNNALLYRLRLFYTF